MIRYELVAGPDAPRMDGAEVDALVAEGYTRASAFRTRIQDRAAFDGEILVAPDRTTAAAVYLSSGRVGAALHTELEDGTYVLTEQRPPLLQYLVVKPGVTIPLEGTRMRFPAVRDVRELLEQHRAHVAEVSRERGSRPSATMSPARYVELRHREQRKRKPQRDFQAKAAAVSLGLGAVPAIALAVFTVLRGGPPSFVGAGVVGALSFPVLTYLFFAPWLMKLGIGPKPISGEAASVAASAEGTRTTGTVKLHDPGKAVTALAAAVMVCGLVSTTGSLLAALDGGRLQWMGLLFSFVAASWTSSFVEHLLGRTSNRTKDVTLRVEGGKVTGPRVPVDLERVKGCVVTRAATPTLMAFDARGRVILRAEGEAETLGPLARAITPSRERFPLENRAARVATMFFGVPVAAALAALGLGAPKLGVLAAAGLGLALGPLVRLAPRGSIEIGVDGLLVAPAFGRETFLSFAELSSVKLDAGVLVVEKKDGGVVRVRAAVTDCASKAVDAWKAHAERAKRRDDALAVRRRVAVDESVADAPYRAASDETEELVEAVLDSAENRSVRVLAARKLAMRPEDDAARARTEAAHRVADPDVQRELAKKA